MIIRKLWRFTPDVNLSGESLVVDIFVGHLLEKIIPAIFQPVKSPWTFDKKIILLCVLLYLKLYFSDIYRFSKYLSTDNRVELNIKDLHKQKFNVCCLLYDGVMKNWKLFIHFLILKTNTKFIWIDRYSDKGFISGKQVVLSNHRQGIQIPAFYIVCSIYSFGCVVHRLYIGHNKMCWYVKCVNVIWYFAKSRKRLKMEFLDMCY